MKSSCVYWTSQRALWRKVFVLLPVNPTSGDSVALALPWDIKEWGYHLYVMKHRWKATRHVHSDWWTKLPSPQDTCTHPFWLKAPWWISAELFFWQWAMLNFSEKSITLFPSLQNAPYRPQFLDQKNMRNLGEAGHFLVLLCCHSYYVGGKDGVIIKPSAHEGEGWQPRQIGCPLCWILSSS